MDSLATELKLSLEDIIKMMGFYAYSFYLGVGSFFGMRLKTSTILKGAKR